MVRRMLLTGAVAVMLMALHTAARADGVTLVQGQTITYTFTSTQFSGTTATATISLQGNQLKITLTNTSTNNTRIKGIGLNTTPNLSVTSSSFTGGMTAFQFSTGGGGLGNMEAVASSTGSTTLNQGQTGMAVFSLSSIPSSIRIDSIIVHFISLPNGNSEKVTGTPGAVPEPATMFLLGTGLAGAAASIRRRRKAEQKL